MLNHAFQILLTLGAFGPFVLGVVDSSFLVLPFGNDILLTILIARHHSIAWEYVPIAAAGSATGVFILDLVCRKGGEEGLGKMMNPKRLEYFKKKIRDRAAYVVALACIAPPPFPFTAVIAAASAFEYPRLKLLSVVFATRMVRFSILAVLATFFGDAILSVVKSRPFFWAMIGFIAICVVASAFSVFQWIQRSRSRSAA